MSSTNTSPLTYKMAGVDIDAGEDLVKRIKPHAKKTLRPEVMGGIGGFAALFQLDWQKYREPVLVSGTDGVGTKLKFAQTTGKHHTIGIDLVAMCVNDVLVCGAEPLFFLDYYSTGKLDVNAAEEVIAGIANGCQQAGCALVGGETAEMPGFYPPGEYDLAGFCVGIVEKSQIITGEQVKPGDVLLGLASSGAHSNGYSLIRKIVERSQKSLNSELAGQPLEDLLLAPTRIYVKSILALQKNIHVHAMAHITGGGLTENLPRVLPDDCQALISTSAWLKTPLFTWLQEQANIADAEMLRTFNCGIGFVVCVSSNDVASCKEILTKAGETVWEIGTIAKKANSDESSVKYL